MTKDELLQEIYTTLCEVAHVDFYKDPIGAALALQQADAVLCLLLELNLFEFTSKGE